ncbi:DUF937 domain-containing protein [Pedobacter sp. NJ-S-72]
MNLIELLKNEVSDNVVSSLSQKAGVTEDQVKTGFSAGIPAVLAGIMKNGTGSDSGLLGKILPGLTGTGAESKTEDLLGGSDDSLLEKGKSLLGGLFGNDTNSVTDAVSASSGLSSEKSAGLMAMIAPLVMGFITKTMASKGWNFSDLLGKLFLKANLKSLLLCRKV